VGGAEETATTPHPCCGAATATTNLVLLAMRRIRSRWSDRGPTWRTASPQGRRRWDSGGGGPGTAGPTGGGATGTRRLPRPSRK
jgi:hypothetical protein